jgi:hypothetical protein
MAWTVLSAAYKVWAIYWFTHVSPIALTISCVPGQIYQAQRERDEKITSLLDVMNKIYAFVDDAKPLQEIESQNKVLKCMAQQTIECGYFISYYSKTKNFRMISLCFLKNI